jgi:transcription termination factor Rho
MYDILQLNDKLVTELKEIAQKLGVKGIAKFSKQDLIYKILDEQALAEKTATNRVVPIVEEPNPQTGRRARKVKSADDDEVETPPAAPAVEPPAPKAPAKPVPVRRERPAITENRPVRDQNRPPAPPEQNREREQNRPPVPEQNRENRPAMEGNRDQNQRRDNRNDRPGNRDQNRPLPNDGTGNRREQGQQRPEGQGRNRDRWEDRRDRRQREWEDRRRDNPQQRPGQPGLFDSDAAKLQNLEEEFVAPGNTNEDEDEVVPMHRPFAPLVGQPEAGAPEQPRPPVAPQEPAEVMPPTVHRERFDVELDGIVEGLGTLEMMPDGYGFLRSPDYNYQTSPDDIYVSPSQIKLFGCAQAIPCAAPFARPRKARNILLCSRSAKSMASTRRMCATAYPSITSRHCSQPPNSPCSPVQPAVILATGSSIFTPIGKGQRGLIVAQPKTGKTFLLKDIANAITKNHPECYVIVLLIDERPEEVTDMRRNVKAEVVASTFDEAAENHVRLANIVLEKSKRMVECGHHVVILLDSITRMARAYNTVAPASPARCFPVVWKPRLCNAPKNSSALHVPSRTAGR